MFTNRAENPRPAVMPIRGFSHLTDLLLFISFSEIDFPNRSSLFPGGRRLAMKEQEANAWAEPPERIALQPEEVHVWRIDLLRERRRREEHLSVLSVDERQRASRYQIGRAHV